MLTSPISCCVCGTTAARPWRCAGDNLLGGETRYRAVRCVRCGVARLDPRPTAEELSQFYAPTTYARAEANTDQELAKRLDTYNRHLARRADFTVRYHLKHSSKQKRQVLDVGCGDGRFLEAMSKRGWAGEGVETDEVAAELARRRTHLVIHETPLESLAFASPRFDLISLLHVLEHVPDPRATLDAARNALRPNGTLLLALPNIHCPEARLFGNAWYHLDLPRHFWGFTPQALSRLVTECGFTVTSIRFFPLLFTPQSLRYALRSLKRGSGVSSQASSSPSRSGKLQTLVFLTLLRMSEILGRVLPGEVMELSAVVNSPSVKK